MGRSFRSKAGSLFASWILREEAALKAHPVRGYLIIAGTFAMAAIQPLYFSGILPWPIFSIAFVLAALFQVAILVRLRLSERRRRQGHSPAQRK
jgi:hypothetical protein